MDLAPFGYNGTCDTKLFNFWIKEKLLPELKQGQIVIMDNASIHKSDETRQLIESVGCKLIFLPPYSPDLNPIEHFLAKLKKVLRYTMHKFESFQDAILAESFTLLTYKDLVRLKKSNILRKRWN